MHFDQAHRHIQRFEAGFQRVNHRACRAVTGVHHQLQRRQVLHINVAQQMVDIGVTQVDFLVATARGIIDRWEVVGFRQALYVAQAGIAADGARAFPHQLHAVVVHRVMAGGHFNTAIDAEVEGGKVNLFGAGKPDIEHVNARVAQAIG